MSVQERTRPLSTNARDEVVYSDASAICFGAGLGDFILIKVDYSQLTPLDFDERRYEQKLAGPALGTFADYDQVAQVGLQVRDEGKEHDEVYKAMSEEARKLQQLRSQERTSLFNYLDEVLTDASLD